MNDLPKAYNPGDHEPAIAKRWDDSGVFNPDNVKRAKKTFSMALPPPNATGVLHLGHAEMIAIQDILARYHRMRGEKTLWLPGTDHAAIATQNVVEKQLKTEGLTKHDLGREKFLQRVVRFVEESKQTIRQQIRSLGASVDWSRERYTMDKGLSEAVQAAFTQLYNDDLLYRGDRIVHWCPRCESTLSDDEVEYRPEKAPFYYLKYGPLVIGTARPETKFLDKAVIVHPDDKRYKKYIGKSFDVEWIGGIVKATVIADKSADPETGTGAMTLTPAHSFADYELAKKHGLEIVQIINEQGELTEAAGKLAGLPVEKARNKVLEILEKKDLVDHIDEQYEHNLSVCYRCGTPIQPLIKKQWFLAVDKPTRYGQSLKAMATEAVASGAIRIIPDRFLKTYTHWMTNLHDWNISRQIWFGHRIPAWYKKGKGGIEEVRVSTSQPGPSWVQDEDVLDTWFSSGLWTFSTLGWPKTTKELKAFHPTAVMETGYDILFFWVARMIMLSTYLTGQVPFETVYLHGLVRDKEGRKMSKSLGNGIDPLEMAKKYGADATRLSLVLGTTPGQDFRLYEEKIAGYRNFVNKLWNVARFILMQEGVREASDKPKPTTLADRWILARLNAVIHNTERGLEEFRFSDVGQALYDFIWHELADWYLEIAKAHLNPSVLRYCLTTICQLAHPFAPFVTETIWNQFSDSLLATAIWPKPIGKFNDDDAMKQFSQTQATVTALRSIRTIYHLPPGQKITVGLPHNDTSIILERLAHVTIAEVEHGVKLQTPLGQATVNLGPAFDAAQERTRLEVDLAKLVTYIKGIEAKLNNASFADRAPAEVVAAEKGKLAEAKGKQTALRQAIDALRKFD